MKKKSLISDMLTIFFSWSAILFFFFSLNTVAQNTTYKEKKLQVTKQKTNSIDEATLRKQMKVDGVSDPVINKLLAQRREWMKKNKNVFWTNARNAQPPIVNAPCNGLGVEGGWGAWSGKQGDNSSGPSNNISWGGASSPPTPASDYAITTGTGVDPNTPSAGNPSIPVVCPGFGNNSIVLNQNCTTGYLCEQLTYPLTVTAQDTNFVYAYAMVIEDAGHPVSEQPFVEFDIYDSVGNVIPCSHQLYTGGPNIPGFYQVNGNGCGYGGDQYKPWTLVGVNLSAYVGHTLNVVIINADCDQGGHFAYSYWDFLCGTSSLSAGCIGSQSTICGPIDPNIAYTYQWYHNGTAMPAPQGIQQCITVIAQPSDVYSVHVQQPSGCDFYMGYVPASIQPGFDTTGHCGTYTFADTTQTSPASVSITGWNWSFPGGTPSTATTQSATVTYNTPGTYTVTLVVTCSAGCSDTVTKIIQATSFPTAAFTNNNPCLGRPTVFTDNSTISSGSITSWSWNFGDGNTSTTANPVHTYTAAGTYSVTFTATSNNNCPNTITNIVTVSPQPIANFSVTAVCVGNPTAFTNQSTGGGTNWSWNFGDGNTSTQQSPTNTYSTAGAYSVTLIATAAPGGCSDTLKKVVTVNPVPTAALAFSPACLGSPVTLTNQSFSPAGSPITQWNWSMPGGNPVTATSSTTATTTYATSGTYTVTLTVATQAGCTSTVPQQVVVYAPPIAGLSGSGTGCIPVCVNNYTDLSTSSNGNITNWQWSFPGGNPSSSTAQNPPSVCYNTSGTYGASLIVTSQYGCKDSVTKTPIVTPRPWPTAGFYVSPTTVSATDPVFNFFDQWSNDVTQYVWTFGDGDSLANVANPVHSYSATVTTNDFYTYDVCLKVQNQYGCWDSTCKTVEIIPEYEFYIPNTFTPNGDGANEFFFGKCRGVKDYNIWIFDRWGNTIWDCHYTGKNSDWDNFGQDGMSANCKWDGKVVQGGMDMSGGSGNSAEEDVYVWKVQLTDVFSKKHNYIGSVTVLK